MKDLADKVAVVTGGGSGIGRAIALELAGAGMHVVLVDLDLAAAERVAGEVESSGVRALPVRTDVADRGSMAALADQTFDELGGAHVLCNNAGIATGGPLDQIRDDDWRWILSVNLEGVVHGVQAFVPRMLEQGLGGHVVNTASIAGMFAMPFMGPYTTTKFAVVGLTESLRADLAPRGIGVSVLCPGFVKTNLLESRRHRPEHLGGPGGEFANEVPGEAAELVQKLFDAGIDPAHVGRRVREGIENDEAWIFTHPEFRQVLSQRFEQILAAFDQAGGRTS